VFVCLFVLSLLLDSVSVFLCLIGSMSFTE
jgi:hypothetical protein